VGIDTFTIGIRQERVMGVAALTRKKVHAARLNATTNTEQRLEFFVPWDGLCSDNRKFVGRYHLSSEYKRASKAIVKAATAGVARCGWSKTPYAVVLSVTVREPDLRRRDFNWSKVTKDAITSSGVVWEDDQQVRHEIWVFDDASGHSRVMAGAVVTITMR
jgi:Holliday junction resolvase RusA-like endonuclease